ncbi:uncharacterized protein [Triticum aestivum]|uniref:uncharacterized protein n=1 Tax=Triticum aestivum TaxID=4565 RepID=UPI001D01B156|nr:uncharacterized protein LOC123103978 [Triticum aestivum]XP_044381620.1 uncharacterized protein LOC123103978 [Triticum aestivum]XP_044381621.1 uncharacterized protein LOC123103978 [Triticum aestivum]XP_044381622.1 uncharacterized protein LOC123103978 [Triticum aestivum]
MATSPSSSTSVGGSPFSSSPPFSRTATSPSTSTLVGESSSSPPVKLVATKENTSVLTEKPRRKGRRNRRDTPTAVMFPPGSVEGRQQPQERRSSLPVKIRYSNTKQRMALSLSQPVDQVGGRFSALVDLPDEEKSSSDEGSETYDTDHVLAWRDPGLPTPVYVRMDSSGVYYTYPTLGDKPLQSLEEVASAVDSYARPNSNAMSDKELSEKDRAVRERLYFPDGTPKVYTRAKVVERERDILRRLVEALLDKRNDDEDRVYELEKLFIGNQSAKVSNGTIISISL